MWTDLLDLPAGHAMTLDDAGILTIDTTPLAMVDAADPLHPVLLATAPEGAQEAAQTAYQHNNLRPHADAYLSRSPAAGARSSRASSSWATARRTLTQTATAAPGPSRRGAPGASTVAGRCRCSTCSAR